MWQTATTPRKAKLLTGIWTFTAACEVYFSITEGGWLHPLVAAILGATALTSLWTVRQFTRGNLTAPDQHQRHHSPS